MKSNNLNNNIKAYPSREVLFECDEYREFRDNQSLLIDRGYEHIENGNYYQAYLLFSLGTLIDNTDSEIFKGLGISLFEMGKLNKSKSILEKAVSLNPEDPITFANLAGVYWELGNFDQAIFNYHKSIDLDPEIEETYFNLVNLYIETGYFYMAFITCNKFIKIFPDNDEIKDLMLDIIINLGISIV